MKKLKKVCKCGNVFSVWYYRKESAKFCLRKCTGKYSKHNLIGLEEGRKYWKGKRIPYFSRPTMKGRSAPWLIAYSKKRRGPLNNNWKGGITTHNRLERAKFRQTILKKVLERDNYTCQLCGEYGKAMQVDHIQSWAEYPSLRFNIENCRTLCQKCHYQITFGKPMPPTIRAWGFISKGENKL